MSSRSPRERGEREEEGEGELKDLGRCGEVEALCLQHWLQVVSEDALTLGCLHLS